LGEKRGASTKVDAIGSFAGATLVVARRAKSRGEAGGHKARPYAQRFPSKR